VFDLYVYTEVCIGIFNNARLFLYIFGICRTVVLIVLQVVYAGRNIRASDYRLIFFLLRLIFLFIEHRALFFGRQSGGRLRSFDRFFRLKSLFEIPVCRLFVFLLRRNASQIVIVYFIV